MRASYRFSGFLLQKVNYMRLETASGDQHSFPVHQVSAQGYYKINYTTRKEPHGASSLSWDGMATEKPQCEVTFHRNTTWILSQMLRFAYNPQNTFFPFIIINFPSHSLKEYGLENLPASLLQANLTLILCAHNISTSALYAVLKFPMFLMRNLKKNKNQTHSLDHLSWAQQAPTILTLG